MLTYTRSDTGSFASFGVSNPSGIFILQTKSYTMAASGPDPVRQTMPHLHNTVLDPTGNFILVPDLGADRVHVYLITPNSVAWTEQDPVVAVPGSGPRHGAFAVSGNNTFFYTVNELSNTITGYKVTYPTNSSLAFAQLFNINTHGPNGTVPAGTTAAEIHVSVCYLTGFFALCLRERKNTKKKKKVTQLNHTRAQPDQRFLLISSRGENSLTISNFDPTNSTQVASDPILSFAIDQSSGALSLVQTASIGGKNPRGFNINKAGTLVASALQDDNRVVVIERDVKTGKLGDFVAWATVGEGASNGPNYVIFNE
jgi:6-phosphogluconolactonase (cycloisomerase 2 family)